MTKKRGKEYQVNNNRFYIAITLIVILLAIFALYERQVIGKCNYEIDHVFVDVESSQWEHATALPLDITITIENPSPLPKYLNKMEYKLYANDEFLAQGVVSDNIKIEPNEKEEVRSSLFLNFNDFSSQTLDAIAQDQVEYKLELKPYFDSFLGRVSYEKVVVKED